MSKLVIILCATVFFASTSHNVSGVETNKIHFSFRLDNLNRKTAIRHIDDAIAKIRGRSAQIYQKVVSLGPQTGGEDSSITVPFFEKVSNRFKGIKKLVNHWISAGALDSINDKKCHDYFADYVSASNSQLMSLKKHVFKDAYDEATKSIGDILHLVNVKRSELNELKRQANDCTRYQCYDFSNAAQKLYNDFFEDTEKAFEYYKKMANGQTVKNMLTFYSEYYDDMGELVIKTIYNCVQNYTDSSI